MTSVHYSPGAEAGRRFQVSHEDMAEPEKKAIAENNFSAPSEECLKGVLLLPNTTLFIVLVSYIVKVRGVFCLFHPGAL